MSVNVKEALTAPDFCMTKIARACCGVAILVAALAAGCASTASIAPTQLPQLNGAFTDSYTTTSYGTLGPTGTVGTHRTNFMVRMMVLAVLSGILCAAVLVYAAVVVSEH